MGNQPLCGSDTRDYRNSTYIVCGKQPDFRNSTSINIVNQIPVISGEPLNFQKQQTFKKVQKSASEFCMKNDLDSSYIPVVARIIAYGHSNIFKAYRTLPEYNKQSFLEEMKFVDIDFMDSLYHRFILGQNKPKKIEKIPSNIVEPSNFTQEEKNKYINVGKSMLAKGETAIMFLCAGSSSRFLFQQKFLYPLELKSQKSLLELMLDRLRRNVDSSEDKFASIPLVFACNQQNRYLIQNFLRSKNFCGFDSSKIRYLQVANMPILDSKGKLCITFECKILERPCGTAKCIEQLLGSGVLQFLKTQKVSALHIVGCENLAQNPGDPFLLGYLNSNKFEIVGKCTDPIFPAEQFNRYGSGSDNKNYLVSPGQIVNSQIPQDLMEKLMHHCPIAMNSIVCGLNQLKSIVKDYSNSMFLSQQFRAIKKNENFYDFERGKPAVKQPVYIFEKEMGHLFTCSKKSKLLRVPREEFIPILSKNQSYSMREACKRLIELHEQTLYFSRVIQ